MSTACAAWIDFAGSLVGALLAGVIALVVMHNTIGENKKLQEDNIKNMAKPMLVSLHGQIAKSYGGNHTGLTIPGLCNVGKGYATNIKIEVWHNNAELSLDKQEGWPLYLSENEVKDAYIHSKATTELRESEQIVIIIEYEDIYGKGYASKYALESGNDNCFRQISVSIK